MANKSAKLEEKSSAPVLESRKYEIKVEEKKVEEKQVDSKIGCCLKENDLKKECEEWVEREVEKRKEVWEKEIRARIKQETVEPPQVTITEYSRESHITDRDFCKRLIKMGVPAKLATNVREQHAELTTKEIWKLIRYK